MSINFEVHGYNSSRNMSTFVSWELLRICDTQEQAEEYIASRPNYKCKIVEVEYQPLPKIIGPQENAHWEIFVGNE